jgi:hypothetical protein
LPISVKAIESILIFTTRHRTTLEPQPGSGTEVKTKPSPSLPTRSDHNETATRERISQARVSLSGPSG